MLSIAGAEVGKDAQLHFAILSKFPGCGSTNLGWRSKFDIRLTMYLSVGE